MPLTDFLLFAANTNFSMPPVSFPLGKNLLGAIVMTGNIMSDSHPGENIKLNTRLTV